MKIEEILKESVAYGAREASMVEKLDARIGMEFEFHVESDNLIFDGIANDDMIQHAITARIETYQEELKERCIPIAKKAKKLFGDTSDLFVELYEQKNEIKNAINNDTLVGSNNLQHIFDYLTGIFKWYNEEYVEFKIDLENLNDYININMDILDPVDFVRNDLGEFLRFYTRNTRNFSETNKMREVDFHMKNYVEFYENLKPYMNEDFDDPSIRNSINQIADDFIEFFSEESTYNDLVELEDLNINPRNYESFEIDRDVIDVDNSEFDTEDISEAAVQFVKQELPNYIDMNFIRNIVHDESVKQGAEVVTKPLEYDEAIGIIDDMCNFIDRFGYTSDSTGLHMNVSLPYDMTLNNIDPLVLLLLLDNKYIDDKFMPRQHVDSMMGYFRGKEYNAAYDLLDNGAQSLIDLTRAYIPTAVKYQQINFSHLGFYSNNSSRIEYRSPGGDYTGNKELLKSELTRLLYMINTTINHEEFYPRKKMLKDVFRLWDKVSYESSGKSFNKIIEEIRNRKTETRKKLNKILDDPMLDQLM